MPKLINDTIKPVAKEAPIPKTTPQVPRADLIQSSVGRFGLFTVLIVAIMFGFLLRAQSINSAETSFSVARLSGFVHEMAVRQREEIIKRASAQLANPASEICGAKGGQVLMGQRPDGGVYGVCSFGLDMQCEEWALFRGQCPDGGVSVANLATPAERYCAITGNELMSGDKCRVGGVLCATEEFFNGSCPPVEL